jgi:hypothetical protein
VIGAQEDAEDYTAFEAAITADYDVQSALETDLVLRVAGLLWRLRRATTIETGLFEIQADHLTEVRRNNQLNPSSREVVYTLFRRANPVDVDQEPVTSGTAGAMLSSVPNSVEPDAHHNVEFARCYLRLAKLPNFALDRLSRYEATLWRQVRQTLLSLDALDRRKPQQRRRRFPIGRRSALPSFGDMNHTRHRATRRTADRKSRRRGMPPFVFACTEQTAMRAILQKAPMHVAMLGARCARFVLRSGCRFRSESHRSRVSNPRK